MLSKILIATDASEASDRVLECVKELRRVGSREALLVHAMNVQDVGGLYASLRRQILPKLEAQKKVLEEAGFEVNIEIPLGVPRHEINVLALERACSLMVVGSHGASLIKDTLLGSTACSIVQSALSPILLVRVEILEENGGHRCRAACENLFGHILFPTDFSDTAERAFQYLEHIVRESPSAVTLLHVQDKGKIDPHLKDRLEEFNRIDAGRLERMRERLLNDGAVSVETEILYGSPAALILERARSNRFTLIVMGTQGRGFVIEILQGSVAHKVAHHAPLPVLFVPAVR